jgi:hypothetical protein
MLSNACFPFELSFLGVVSEVGVWFLHALIIPINADLFLPLRFLTLLVFSLYAMLVGLLEKQNK